MNRPYEHFTNKELYDIIEKIIKEFNFRDNANNKVELQDFETICEGCGLRYSLLELGSTKIKCKKCVEKGS